MDKLLLLIDHSNKIKALFYNLFEPITVESKVYENYIKS